MFRKLQQRMTLLNTLILVAILAATNLSVYFLLQSFNVAQIANEADAMLNTLEASAWLDEDDVETIPQTIDVATPEPDADDADDPERSEDNGSGKDQEHGTGPSSSEGTEREEDGSDDGSGRTGSGEAGTTDGSALAPDNGTPSDEAEPSGESGGGEEDGTMDPDDSVMDPEDSVKEPEDGVKEPGDGARLNSKDVKVNALWVTQRSILAGSGRTPFQATRLRSDGSGLPKAVVLGTFADSGRKREAFPRYANAGSPSTADSAKPASDTASDAISPNGDVRTLHVPAILKQFTFYLVFDLQGNLTAHNVGNLRTLNSLMALAPAIEVQTRPHAQPEVRELAEGPLSRVLLLRRFIEIDGVRYGSYLVGRDLSLVTETMANLRRILLFGFLAGILVSILIGYLLAGRAIRPIREAYEAKQRFLADASHELRTPISVVLLSAESLERALQPGQEEARNDLADIREETFRMRDLVERLLFLARSDSRRHSAGKERVEVSALLAEIGDSLAILAKARQITLEQRVSPELAFRGDRKMLASLFTVLVENAIKYNREEGRVIVECAQIRVKKQSWLEIRVSDTGIGIPAAEQAHIFERFYRADPARSQKAGGHGLGLAIAKEIVEAHGGTIGVVSQPDIGTTFTVRLPAAEGRSSTVP